jgi:hypothetical protein
VIDYPEYNMPKIYNKLLVYQIIFPLYVLVTL